MPLHGRRREYRLTLRSLSSLPSRNCQTLGGREESSGRFADELASPGSLAGKPPRSTYEVDDAFECCHDSALLTFAFGHQ